MANGNGKFAALAKVGTVESAPGGRRRDPAYQQCSVILSVANRQEAARLLIGLGVNFGELMDSLLAEWIAEQRKGARKP